MTIHIISTDGVRLLPSDRQAEARKGVIAAMEGDLVAAAYVDGLDLTSSSDVATYLAKDVCYPSVSIHLYADAAVLAAQETIMTIEMGVPQ